MEHSNLYLFWLPLSDESQADDTSNTQDQYNKVLQNILTALALLAFFVSSSSFGAREQQQV